MLINIKMYYIAGQPNKVNDFRSINVSKNIIGENNEQTKVELQLTEEQAESLHYELLKELKRVK